MLLGLSVENELLDVSSSELKALVSHFDHLQPWY